MITGTVYHDCEACLAVNTPSTELWRKLKCSDNSPGVCVEEALRGDVFWYDCECYHDGSTDPTCVNGIVPDNNRASCSECLGFRCPGDILATFNHGTDTYTDTGCLSNAEGVPNSYISFDPFPFVADQTSFLLGKVSSAYEWTGSGGTYTVTKHEPNPCTADECDDFSFTTELILSANARGDWIFKHEALTDSLGGSCGLGATGFCTLEDKYIDEIANCDSGGSWFNCNEGGAVEAPSKPTTRTSYPSTSESTPEYGAYRDSVNVGNFARYYIGLYRDSTVDSNSWYDLDVVIP